MRPTTDHAGTHIVQGFLRICCGMRISGQFVSQLICKMTVRFMCEGKKLNIIEDVGIFARLFGEERVNFQVCVILLRRIGEILDCYMYNLLTARGLNTNKCLIPMIYLQQK